MATLQTAGELREALQALIDAKERQLQHTGQLGQRVLEQQVELEARVEQLRDAAADAGDEDDVDPETRALFSDLSEAVHGWDADNVKLSDAFSNKVRDQNFGLHILDLTVCFLLADRALADRTIPVRLLYYG
jgi:ABC-type transporter Mla subunit MlaD